MVSAFITGVILSIVVAAMSAWPNEGGNHMTDRKVITVETPQPPDTYIHSLTGMGQMRPDQTTGESAPQQNQQTGKPPQDNAGVKPGVPTPVEADTSK